MPLQSLHLQVGRLPLRKLHLQALQLLTAMGRCPGQPGGGLHLPGLRAKNIR